MMNSGAMHSQEWGDTLAVPYFPLCTSGALTPVLQEVRDALACYLLLSCTSGAYPFIIPLLIRPQVLLPVSSPYLFPLVYLSAEACSTVQH